MMRSMLAILCILLSGFSQTTATLRVEISNVRRANAKIWIALYKPNDTFGDEKPKIYKILDVKSAGNQVGTFQLEPGRYALALFQDINGNEVLDKNFVGIPKEPYGFSKDFRPRFSAPSFEDCAFDLAPGGSEISVKLTN